jgi:transcriptional regulator of acetoin/glycerol metabolism
MQDLRLNNMEDNYYKLLNFITKLSRPKLKDEVLEKLSNFNEKKGETALDIFENGIDSAEAIIAIEARRVLKNINIPENVDITKLVKESQESLLDEEQIIKKAFLATGGHAVRMSSITGMPIKSVYTKMKKYNLNRKTYRF